jgi:hypothetical protein
VRAGPRTVEAEAHFPARVELYRRSVTGSATRLVRVDIETDRLISDSARLLGRSKKDFVAAAVGVYVEQHRERLTQALNRASFRIEDAGGPDEVDPRTGLTRSAAKEIFGWLR